MEAATKAATPAVSFDTSPDRYRHWKLTFDGPVATLSMDVQEDAGLSPDYKLKLNSYDLGVDDGNSAVSLPETPLLGVLPGTGGLTRVVDKRKVRRDLADVFGTVAEGVKGKRAVEWRLVDAVFPTSQFKQRVAARARELAAKSDRPANATGIALTPLKPRGTASAITYSAADVQIDRTKH